MPIVKEARNASLSNLQSLVEVVADNRWSLAIHGGAGEISDKASIPVRYAVFKEIVEQGRAMLEDGATALDTCEFVVAQLEDCEYFNAGRGSVFTHVGTHEMDACIMDGTGMQTGAVSNVHNVRNPVKLARVVANHTQHVLLSGMGAEALATQHDIVREDNAYFHTTERYNQLLKARRDNSVVLDHGGALQQDKQSYAKMKPVCAPAPAALLR
jgi:beta-aspartyl-peptidase (threonine type)